MRDGYTMRRRQWLRRLSRQFNRSDLQREERTWHLSDRIALVVFAFMVVTAVLEAVR